MMDLEVFWLMLRTFIRCDCPIACTTNRLCSFLASPLGLHVHVLVCMSTLSYCALSCSCSETFMQRISMQFVPSVNDALEAVDTGRENVIEDVAVSLFS